MDSVNLMMEKFYQAMCESIDGYVFVCSLSDGGYEVILPQDFVEEFGIPPAYRTRYFESWLECIHEEDREKYKTSLQSMFDNKTCMFCLQYRAKNRNDKWIWLESRAHLSYDDAGNPLILAGVIYNLGRQNHLDHVTGLLNKYAFREVINQKIKDHIPFGVLLLNIDDFHHINELYDQTFGDSVLRTIGTYIQSRLDSNAAIYRMDGDEYGILIMNPQKEEAEQLYNRISNHYKTQKELQGHLYYCTFSAIYHEYDDEQDYNDIVKALKVGMNIVKQQGKGRYLLFRSEFLKFKERELELIEMLRHSIENDFEGFELQFQPQVYADSKDLKGAEALLRWECEKYGKISPVEFIPLLEKSDMIQTVGKWVFRQAVNMCKAWVCIYPQFSMSINVSYLQLFDPHFVEFMRDCVAEAGISYQNIIVEITESKFISDKEILKQVFDSVREMGMKVAMDDFGTGYSSLGILKEAPADIVKIDKIFVQNIKENSFDSSFIRVVVELCHKVGIKVCLEGVEEDEEMDVVSDMDLDFIQGFLYGKPEQAENFYHMYLSNG